MRKIFNFQFSIFKRNKGFTLIELLIVMVIIGVLATLLMSNFIGVRQRARDAQRKADLRQIQSAFELYRSDNGTYPTTLYSTACPTSGSIAFGGVTYMQKVPCDPGSGGGNYRFSGPSGTSYSLFSCLENIADKSGQATLPPGGAACTPAWYFVVTNP